MEPWQIFAREVSQQLRENPEARLDEATRNARVALVGRGYPSSLIETMQGEFAAHKDVFRFGGLISPSFLSVRLQRNCYKLLVSGMGVFGVVAELAYSLQGNVSRHVTYGVVDAILVAFCTEPEKNALVERLAASRLQVESMNVTRTLRSQGFVVPPASPEMRSAWMATSSEKLATLDLLTTDYWNQELSDSRGAFLNQGALLGRGLIEDTKSTGQHRAFVGIRISSVPLRHEVDSYLDEVLTEPRLQHAIRSVYYCEGASYTLFVDVCCGSSRELDEITDKLALGRAWRPWTLQVDTETHVVARTVDEVFPVTRSDAIRLPRSGMGVVHLDYISDLERRFVDPLPGQLRDRYDAVLQEEERFFMLGAISGFGGFPAEGLSEEAQIGVSTARDIFVASYINQSIQELSNSVVTIARALESTCRQALRQSFDLLYRGRLGLAQVDLKLKSTSLNDKTLGDFNAIFEAIDSHHLYQLLGVSYPDHFRQTLRTFTWQRNRFTHDGLPAEFHSDFRLAARNAASALHQGLELLDWLRNHVLEAGLDISPQKAIELILEVRRESDLVLRLKEEHGIQLELQTDRLFDRIAQAERTLASIDNEHFVQIMAELSRIIATGATSKRHEERWRQLAKRLSDEHTQIIANSQERQGNQMRGVLRWLGSATQDVSLGLVANAISEVLLGVNAEYLEHLVQEIRSCL